MLTHQKFDVVAYRRAIEGRIAGACAVVRRADWGARAPLRPLELDWNYDSIVVHYTGHDNLTNMRGIQSFDLDHRHWDDVAYHYAISPTGQVFEGRELIYKGSHVRLQNTGKVGIVCMGDFDTGLRSLFGGHGYGGDTVQPAMLDALKRLSLILKANFPIRVFGGHLEFGESETCPGSNLIPAVRAMRDELGLAQPVHRSL